MTSRKIVPSTLRRISGACGEQEARTSAVTTAADSRAGEWRSIRQVRRGA